MEISREFLDKPASTSPSTTPPPPAKGIRHEGREASTPRSIYVLLLRPTCLCLCQFEKPKKEYFFNPMRSPASISSARSAPTPPGSAPSSYRICHFHLTKAWWRARRRATPASVSPKGDSRVSPRLAHSGPLQIPPPRETKPPGRGETQPPAGPPCTPARAAAPANPHPSRAPQGSGRVLSRRLTGVLSSYCTC